MALRLQDLVNSRFGIGFALAFGRLLPQAIAYRLIPVLADRMSQRRNSAMIEAVRANQWVVHGEQASDEQLDRLVRDTFRHTGHCLYDLYHNLNKSEEMQRLIRFGPNAGEYLNSVVQRERGLIIVGAHMSNFDFVLQSAGRLGFRGLALGMPEQIGGYKRQNELRRSAGLDIVPTSLASIRLAGKRLREGDIVVTGVDRPLEGSSYLPRFFGRPAAVTVHHILLALKEDVPIVAAAAILRPSGTYDILVSDPIEMSRGPNRRAELIANAEAVLAQIERFIQIAPEQWSMFYPVWPDALDELR
jgi:KDO2-lipid IV(A) lauroyltransferase